MEAFFNHLLKLGIDVLIDVRANPISRKFGFSGAPAPLSSSRSPPTVAVDLMQTCTCCGDDRIAIDSVT